MREHEARRSAAQGARKTQEYRFVVYEYDGYSTAHSYYVAREEELDTFYAGITQDNIIASYDPDGVDEAEYL